MQENAGAIQSLIEHWREKLLVHANRMLMFCSEFLSHDGITHSMFLCSAQTGLAPALATQLNDRFRARLLAHLQSAVRSQSLSFIGAAQLCRTMIDLAEYFDGFPRTISSIAENMREQSVIACIRDGTGVCLRAVKSWSSLTETTGPMPRISIKCAPQYLKNYWRWLLDFPHLTLRIHSSMQSFPPITSPSSRCAWKSADFFR
jgi:hypothetical protein